MTLTVVSYPVDGGDVTCQPASAGGQYYPYDNVTLAATPKPDYAFVNWTGDVANIEDTTQTTIVVAMDKYFTNGDQQIEITANFAKRPRIPWGWVGGGLAAFLIVALSLAILVRGRKTGQADSQSP